MRNLLLSLFTLLVCTATAQSQQLQQASKSEAVAARARQARGGYPRIAISGKQCMVKDVSIVSNGKDQHALRFRFIEECNASKEIDLPFEELEDAIAVKALVMDKRDYDVFSIIPAKAGNRASFELIYMPLVTPQQTSTTVETR